jgi:hypothetical protein
MKNGRNMVKWVNAMSVTKLKTLTIAGIILFVCLLSYKLGQGDPVIIEKIVEVKVYDKGFCASCYKAHNWDEMYVMMNEITN